MTSLFSMFYNKAVSMELKMSNENIFDCGVVFNGDNVKTKGYIWFFANGNNFSVTKCDLTILKEMNVELTQKETHMSIGLQHFKGKDSLTSDIEEPYRSVNTKLKAGQKIQYVEYTFLPDFYKEELRQYYTIEGIYDSPINVIKNMISKNNYNPSLINILMQVKNCDYKGYSAQLFHIAKGYELLSELVNMSTKKLPKKNKDYLSLIKVIEYISASLDKPIKLEDLTALIGVSGTKLKMMFKQFTGKSISHYIAEKRAQKATQLLLNTKLSIDEIAPLVGFKTPTGFATSFKKATGIPPSHIRKK